MSSRDSRLRSRGVVAGLVLAILTLATPSLVVAADVTVDQIPGNGWIQGPDNSAGLAAVIVESPEAGLGDDSVELTTETATSDFVGIGRAGLVAGPLSDITGGSWMTYAPVTPACSMRSPRHSGSGCTGWAARRSSRR